MLLNKEKMLLGSCSKSLKKQFVVVEMLTKATGGFSFLFFWEQTLLEGIQNRSGKFYARTVGDKQPFPSIHASFLWMSRSDC